MRRHVMPAALATCLVFSASAWAAGDPESSLAADIVGAARLGAGGLCVHLCAGDGRLTAALAEGRGILVHGLESDPAAADEAIRYLRSRGLYGQAWVEPHAGPRLPHTDNLVNLLVADDLGRTDVPLAEAVRVLVPGGVGYVGQAERFAVAGRPLTQEALRDRLAAAGVTEFQIIRRGGLWACFRKPRPAEMDDWGHPRHGADGNAVSRDLLVGPPRRIRWLAGPAHEASNMVTAGGRLFLGGIIARDAFNGLRLWQRPLQPSPMRLGYPAVAMPGSVLPVACGDLLFAVTGGRLLAIDAATGLTVRTYDCPVAPLEFLHEDGRLVALDAGAVRAFAAADGKALWKYPAVQPMGAVAGDQAVFVIETVPEGGRNRAIVRLHLVTGRTEWRQAGYDWLSRVRRLAYAGSLLLCEASTFDNNRPGNAIHVLDARDGRQLWERAYEPGMNHYMQARALLVADSLWLLANGQWQSFDARSGSPKTTFDAGPNHCYPPIATRSYLLGEEMSFTDISTGLTDANRISKGACSRDTGFVPANGLLYVAPKHCSCYPMLKEYTALAPAAAPGRGDLPWSPDQVLVERGPAFGQSRAARRGPAADEWPCYRADLRRSAAAATPAATELDVLWTARLGDWPHVPMLADWKENLFVRGPITPPTVADGLVLVARSDEHRIVALDADTGNVRWEFTANGRIDTPPTVAAGLCLFGTRSGWIYAVCSADGRLAWRMRPSPEDRRIVAHGQVESAWPVSGSLLVIGDTVYAAAGRHPLADGGVRILAIDPAAASVRWIKTIDTLPMKGFYLGAGLEFDPIDLLVAEWRRPAPGTCQQGPVPREQPDFLTMSRWQIDLANGGLADVWKSGFGYFAGPAGGVMAPRGLWTYGPRMDYISSGPRPGQPDYVATARRPLAAFRNSMLVACTEDGRRIFRRDFTAESAAAFDDVWYCQRMLPRKGASGERNRHERLAAGAAWTADVFDSSDGNQQVAALVLAGDAAYVAGTGGQVAVFAAADGRRLASRLVQGAAPLWDGMACAYGHLYMCTCDGKVVCLGRRRGAQAEGGRG